MKFCIIAPDSHLELSDYGSAYFLIANRCRNNGYLNFYLQRNKNKLTIIDNGAFEQEKPVHTDELLNFAKWLNVDEIVAPDLPKQPKQSLKLTLDFLDSLSVTEQKRFKIQVVPHGKTYEEYKKNTRKLVKREVETIGFSIIDLWKNWEWIRPFVVHSLLHEIPELKKKELHLLGLDCLAELYTYQNACIRSVDTSLPISLAFHKSNLAAFSETHSRVEDNARLSSRYRLAVQNISTLRKVAESL